MNARLRGFLLIATLAAATPVLGRPVLGQTRLGADASWGRRGAYRSANGPHSAGRRTNSEFVRPMGSPLPAGF
jgi:hypothetical protein